MLFAYEMPAETGPTQVESASCAICPVCNGDVCEFRGAIKCRRCQFVYCQGCEAETPSEDVARDEW